MRRSCLQLSWAVLVASLLAPQIFAGGTRQLVGKVETTSGITLDGTFINRADAVFSGDVLTTLKGTSAIVKFPGARQTDVMPQTSVRFQLDVTGGPLAQVSLGTVLTTTTGKNAVVVETPKYKVEPADRQRAVYLVAVMENKSTLIAARRGDVSITEIRSGKSYLLGGGLYIVIESSAAGFPGQQQEKSEQAPGKPAGQKAPSAPQPATSEQPPAKPAGQAAPPVPSAKPAQQPWHIGSLSHGSSIGLVVAIIGGAAGGAAAALSGGGGGVVAASPSAP